MDCITLFYLNSAQSALQIHIYPFTHRWPRLLSKVPTFTWGVVGGSVSCSRSVCVCVCMYVCVCVWCCVRVCVSLSVSVCVGVVFLWLRGTHSTPDGLPNENGTLMPMKCDTTHCTSEGGLGRETGQRKDMC